MVTHVRKVVLGGFLFLIFAVAGVVFSVITVTHRAMKIKIGDQVFDVDAAITMRQKAKGLAGRSQLAEHQGMLFLFDDYGSHGFWMAGMKMPIDIIWIKDNEVVGIESQVSVGSQEQYYPPQPVNRVLEVAAGIAEAAGIHIGDAVHLQ